MKQLVRVVALSLTAVACAALLCTGAALATPTAQEKCDNARITAWKKYVSCVESQLAKDAKQTIFDDMAAFAKCRHAYFKKWTAFQPTASLAGRTRIGSRYSDNRDQTVTDNLSGLVWEKKDDLGGIHDKDNAYQWSTGFPYKENGTTFTGFLATVNGGGGFAGANGWRLPTLAELQTIVLDFACTGLGGGATCRCPVSPSSACVDPALDSGNTQSNFYWSATGWVADSGSVWCTDFDSGAVARPVKTQVTFVRAVSGGF